MGFAVSACLRAFQAFPTLAYPVVHVQSFFQSVSDTNSSKISCNL